jgi:hypothetical protein
MIMFTGRFGYGFSAPQLGEGLTPARKKTRRQKTRQVGNRRPVGLLLSIVQTPFFLEF